MTLLKTYNQTNQFPGKTKTNTIEQIRKWTKEQKKIKGFNFTIAIGNSIQNLQLPGEARFLLGFKIFTSTPPSMVDFSIILNNEQMIDGANINVMNILPTAGNNYQEYLPINRQLSGQDTLDISFRNNDGAAYLSTLMAFYL